MICDKYRGKNTGPQCVKYANDGFAAKTIKCGKFYFNIKMGKLFLIWFRYVTIGS
jgi:hypothetical protein